MKASTAAPRTADPSMEDSAKALAEVLSRARKALEDYYQIHGKYTTGKGLPEAKQLSRENELLKKALSELDKLMKEKL